MSCNVPPGLAFHIWPVNVFLFFSVVVGSLLFWSEGEGNRDSVSVCWERDENHFKEEKSMKD